MVLPNSSILALSGVFYRMFRDNEDVTKDAMSILKILDFSWNPSKKTLSYEREGKSVEITKDMCLNRSPFEVIPFKNISRFDLDCLERVLNTRAMVGVKSASDFSPLFECIGWMISKDGDTYRLHYVGGTSYWESPDYVNEEDAFSISEQSENLQNSPPPVSENSLRVVRLSYPINPKIPDWDPNKEIPERWDTP